MSIVTHSVELCERVNNELLFCFYCYGNFKSFILRHYWNKHPYQCNFIYSVFLASIFKKKNKNKIK